MSRIKTLKLVNGRVVRLTEGMREVFDLIQAGLDPFEGKATYQQRAGRTRCIEALRKMGVLDQHNQLTDGVGADTGSTCACGGRLLHPCIECDHILCRADDAQCCKCRSLPTPERLTGTSPGACHFLRSPLTQGKRYTLARLLKGMS